MAGRRIRTIKPELFEDGKTARLTCSAFRLFVGCISLADDYGILRGDVEYLAGQIFWGRREVDVDVALRELLAVGMLEAYRVRDQDYLHVCGWEKHQKIDRPSTPRLPGPADPDAERLASPREPSRASPPPSQEESRALDPRARARDLDLDLGPRTVDRDLAGGSLTAPAKRQASPVKAGTTPGALAFAAYAEAYRQRYGTDPVRNHKVNIAFADLAKRLPAEEAPEVAAYYVHHGAAFYVQSGHAPGLLLRDCEKLRTEWATGRQVNAHTARQNEQTAGNAAWQYAQELERKEREGR